jgi:gliding motility-associated-like protein
MNKNLYKILIALILFLQQFAATAQSDSKLKFVENKNQWESQVLYKTDLQGGHIYFTNNAFRFAYYSNADLDSIHELKHAGDLNKVYNAKINCFAYELNFLNGNKPEVSTSEKYNEYNNYILGNDASKWASNVNMYKRIKYQNMYDGIDILASSEDVKFKYDIIVHPNANANSIQIQYSGLLPKLLKNGNLELNIGFTKLQELAPYCYQIIEGEKHVIESNYKLSQNGILGYNFPHGYNKNYDLIVDPVLVFATYSTSTTSTFGFSATYDNSGNLYAGGECFNIGWPATLGAFQVTFGGNVDAGINKYNAAGSALIFSTYYGGSGQDLPNNLIVNTNDELAMTGSTTSANLPTTTGCYDNTLNGNSDAYVVRFNANGNAMLGATYIGGSGIDAQNSSMLSPNYGDWARGEIFYDVNNEIVVATSSESSNFPTTTGAYQTVIGGMQDGVFFKLNATCSNLIFSTYLGGANNDACFSVAKNSLGNWVLCGGTMSTNFPTTAGAATPIAPGGGRDAFVTILNNTATANLQSTYIGTNDNDHAFKIQVDPFDTIYVCGQTTGVSFPVSAGVYNNTNGTIFIQKLTPSLNATVISTRIGQTSNLVPTAFLKDFCGNVYFCGFQAQSGLPLTPNAFQSTTGGFWLCVLSGDFTNLVYATYMGAPGDHVDGGTSRFDPQGKVYHSVCTNSISQYQSIGCLSPTNNTNAYDVASFKFDFQLAGVAANIGITPNDSGCAPYTVVFNNSSNSGLTYFWDFGDGFTSTLAAPTHTYLLPGLYNVMFILTNLNTSCFGIDTAYTTIKVIKNVSADFKHSITLGCTADQVSFSLLDPLQGASVTHTWYFGDGYFNNNFNPTHTYTAQGIYTAMCVATNSFCTDTFKVVLNLVHPIVAAFTLGPADSICLGVNAITNGGQSQVLSALAFTWIWGDGTFTNSKPLGNHSYTQPGIYPISLIVTDTLGCSDTMSKNLFVDDPGFSNFTLSSNSICIGQPIFILDSISIFAKSFNFNFDDGYSIFNVHNPTHVYTVSKSNYTITLNVDYSICPDKVISKTIDVFSYPEVNLGADASICTGLTPPITLSNSLLTIGTNLWNTGSYSFALSVIEPGIYWLQVNNNNCLNADTVEIKRDCYLNIPNSFSPNEDNLSDYFLPRDLLSSGLQSYSMKIFNRWGENVFITNNINGKGWDGKFGLVNQPIGVYVYTIDALFANGIKKQFKGNVTLLR